LVGIGHHTYDFSFPLAKLAVVNQLICYMTTKDKVKKEIDRLSEHDVQKVYLYLDTLKKQQKDNRNIRALHLKGKLDQVNLRSAAYE